MAITSVNPTTYEAALKDGDKVEIGDKGASKFKPHIKLNRWGQECFIKCSIPDDGHSSLVAEQNKIKWVNSKTESHFYPLGEDGFEWEIILKEKPASNIVTINIESQGLDFYYQPALDKEYPTLPDGWTATEIEILNEQGERVRFRPENVVGSYAVYHATKGNAHNGEVNTEKYKCGKAFHIYRPHIHDLAEKAVWGQLAINEGIITITIPQEFLDNAVYPVTVDPTFGYTTAGSSGSGIAINDIYAFLDTAPENGTVDSISVYASFLGPGSSMDVKGVMTLDSALTILANGVSPNSSYGWSTVAWRTMTYSTSPSISNGVDYLIGIIGSGDLVITLYYDTGSGTNSKYDTTNSYASPADWGSATSVSDKYSIYATYTAAGVNAAGQAGSATSTAAGMRWSMGALAASVSSSIAGFRRLNRPGAGAAASASSSLAGMRWSMGAVAASVSASTAGFHRLNRPGAAQADSATLSLAGMRRLNIPIAGQADSDTSSGAAAFWSLGGLTASLSTSNAGMYRLNRPGAGQAASLSSSLAGLIKTWNMAAQADSNSSSAAGLFWSLGGRVDSATLSMAGFKRLNRPGVGLAASLTSTYAGMTGGTAISVEEIFRNRRLRHSSGYARRPLKGVF